MHVCSTKSFGGVTLQSQQKYLSHNSDFWNQGQKNTFYNMMEWYNYKISQYDSCAVCTLFTEKDKAFPQYLSLYIHSTVLLGSASGFLSNVYTFDFFLPSDCHNPCFLESCGKAIMDFFLLLECDSSAMMNAILSSLSVNCRSICKQVMEMYRQSRNRLYWCAWESHTINCTALILM